MVLLVGPALAETGNGSKNFRVPASVPNYFSNEAGPMMGGPAESRRVDLYPNPATAPRQLDTVTTSPVPRGRHVATGHGRMHLAAHMRGGRHPVAARDHTRTHIAGRGGPPSHAKHAGASHTTRVSSTHHRARG
ncbi:MAG TPA: hypothetical protein VN808_13990 [Stellaceae bacterium]|nr:hypothetical protein [Stellaceae bacterium]